VFTAAVLLALLGGCRDEPEPPIVIEGNRMTVQNLTRHAWIDVEIWMNDHYRVTRSRINAGQRFTVPLDTFVAGFGQRFDVRSQPIFSVELTGRSEDGSEIRYVRGQPRRR
jgi:hypothetical protein